MLVTDGVPYNYKELFERFNWKYDTPVRVFTYLIGREVKVVTTPGITVCRSHCGTCIMYPLYLIHLECGTLLTTIFLYSIIYE